jgi:Immunity protein 53
MVTVDLTHTSLASRSEKQRLDISDNDWYHYSIENGKFTGAGDIFKLEFLLKKFADIILSEVNS